MCAGTGTVSAPNPRNASETAEPRPVSEAERIRTLDVLRGLALLGILTINIRYFAIPLRRLNDPAFPGDQLQPGDFWAWLLGNIFLEDKMIALFSMLFGAGIVLLSRRLQQRAPDGWKIYYRRIFWLFVIGLLHAFLLWFGDILMTYALCGAVFFFLRKLPPWPLLALGCTLVAFAPGRTALPALYKDFTSPPVQTTVKMAQTPTPESEDSPFEEEVQAAAYRGSYTDLFRWRARVVKDWHFLGAFDFDFWRCGGFILIGMALFSAGFLSGAKPTHVYWGVLLLGLSLGLLLVVLGVVPQWHKALYGTSDWTSESRRILGSTGQMLRHLAALFLAPAYASAIVLLCKVLELRPLASVGRMALTNYLMQTVFCVVVFEGWGLGWWGQLSQTRLWTVVLLIWLFQVMASTVWLRFCQFGPVEWAWRSLSYKQVQPMRRLAASSGKG